MKARLVTLEDRSEWLRLLRNLYVETTDADHLASVEAYLLGRPIEELVPSAVFVVDRPGGGLSGLLELSVGFYRDTLGFPTPGIVGTEFEHGSVAFFDLQSGLKLALWRRADLAHDTGLPAEAHSSTEFSLGHNVRSQRALANERLHLTARVERRR